MRGYLSSRVPFRLFVPLAAFLVSAGFASVPSADMTHWLLATVVAFLLVLQFRLWDDIADLERDRAQHPQRWMCQSDDLSPFYSAAAILVVTNACVLTLMSDYLVGGIVFPLLCLALLGSRRYPLRVAF